jgi:hypothetical protein
MSLAVLARKTRVKHRSKKRGFVLNMTAKQACCGRQTTNNCCTYPNGRVPAPQMGYGVYLSRKSNGASRPAGVKCCGSAQLPPTFKTLTTNSSSDIIREKKDKTLACYNDTKTNISSNASYANKQINITVAAKTSSLQLTVQVPEGTTSVRLTGPWWNWDNNGGPVASDNGDNTWTVTFDPAPTAEMKYLWVVDQVMENLVDNAQNGELADMISAGIIITDNTNWANRVWILNSGNVTNNVFDAANSLQLTVQVPEGTASVRLTGPWWNWDNNGGPVASDNGDNTWTVTLDPAPTAEMKYLWVVDQVMENLVDNAQNGELADMISAGIIITDNTNWANRVWILNSGNVTNNVFDAANSHPKNGVGSGQVDKSCTLHKNICGCNSTDTVSYLRINHPKCNVTKDICLSHSAGEQVILKRGNAVCNKKSNNLYETSLPRPLGAIQTHSAFVECVCPE